MSNYLAFNVKFLTSNEYILETVIVPELSHVGSLCSYHFNKNNDHFLQMFKNPAQIFIGLAGVPFSCKMLVQPKYHILSIAVEISRNTSVTSQTSLKDLQTLCVRGDSQIENSALNVDSAFGEMREGVYCCDI